MTPTSAPQTATRRDITRAATVDEIKTIALGIMRENGAAAVRFSDIAREMRMSPPALYRYFSCRDDLLTELITDSFDNLADALRTAREAIPEGDLSGRLHAVSSAYRAWAAREPARFGLVFGIPVPGYSAPECGPTNEAHLRAMENFMGLVRAAGAPETTDGHLAPVPDALLAELTPAELIKGISPERMQGLLHSWAMLHGYTCLEAYGHLGWLGEAARDDLFDGIVRCMASVTGLPHS
jgi:AcrR family transcriptional regulator